MSHTTVRTHTRRGYPVQAHSRRTVGRSIADVLTRDLDKMHEEQNKRVPLLGIVGADPDCPHPAWSPVRRLLLDTPYEDIPILAYCCTGCAASRPVVNGGTE